MCGSTNSLEGFLSRIRCRALDRDRKIRPLFAPAFCFFLACIIRPCSSSRAQSSAERPQAHCAINDSHTCRASDENLKCVRGMPFHISLAVYSVLLFTGTGRDDCTILKL